tara:strand:- start:225 stop:1910 length:1686 start_codon:yes stop_codon:yes gene_type:complete
MVRKKGGRNILQDLVDPVRIEQEKISAIGNEDTKNTIKDLEKILKEKVDQDKKSERIMKEVKSYVNSMKPENKTEDKNIYDELNKKLGGNDEDDNAEEIKKLKLYYLLKYSHNNEYISNNNVLSIPFKIFENTGKTIDEVKDRLIEILKENENNSLKNYLNEIHDNIHDNIQKSNTIYSIIDIYKTKKTPLHKAILIEKLINNKDTFNEEFLRFFTAICKIEDINDENIIANIFKSVKESLSDDVEFLMDTYDECIDWNKDDPTKTLKKIEMLSNQWKNERDYILYPNFLYFLQNIKNFHEKKQENTDENNKPQTIVHTQSKEKQDDQSNSIPLEAIKSFLNQIKKLINNKNDISLCSDIKNNTLREEIGCPHQFGQGPKNFRSPPKYIKNLSKNELETAYYSLKNGNLLYDIDISSTDIMIFIIATFVIRTIALAITGWLIETEMITNFEDAIYFYVGIYTILFGITVTLVNLGYTPNDLLKDLPNYLYYMFITSNGFFHLLFHIGFLIALGFIPTLLKKYNDDQQMAPPDAEEKRNIYRSVARFSMVSWIILGVLAFAM